MNLQELREKIDEVDGQLVQLIEQRMDIAGQIADYKKENHLPVLDAAREREKLARVSAIARPDMQDYTRVLYSLLFELSRSYQSRLVANTTEQYELIHNAIENTPKLFPKSAQVVCQGVDGSFSTMACERIFANPHVMYVKNFEGVFSAIESGLCEYGIIPIENSTAGSVKQVYDLMIEHNFYIVRSTRIKVNHCLLAKPNTKKAQIREIYSHEQAIAQCADFLKSMPDVKVTCCENTAEAAAMVAQSDRSDVAALSSYRCAELYGLQCLESTVQDNGNNHTRFICISRKPEIYPGADKTTLMMILPHRPGALYKVLARLYALGINLQKLESRPLPDRDFEFMFYFDLETSIYSDEFVQLICELGDLCEECKYLGSYSEVI